MQRLRLKADGRIVELRDGQEFPLAPVTTSAALAAIGVPVETIRNWEQGKRMPRGPARALLAVIAHAPETVFAALATDSSPV
jgi:putative transcriptional regulator